MEYAVYIGLDPVKEPHLLWIAEEGMQVTSPSANIPSLHQISLTNQIKSFQIAFWLSYRWVLFDVQSLPAAERGGDSVKGF